MAYTDLYEQYFGGRQKEESDTEANVIPRSTTINYNEDGSHEVTHKMTVAPVAPEEAPVMKEPQVPVSTAPVAPPITPTPAASAILGQPPGQPVAIPQAPQQVPAPGQAQMQPQMPTEPVAPAAPGQAEVAQTPANQLQQPVAPSEPMIAGGPTTDIGATPTEQAVKQQQLQPKQQPNELHESNLMHWSDDPRKLQLIANDKRTPEEGGPPDHVKKFANDNLAEYYSGKKKENQELRRVQKMEADGDTAGIARILSKNEPEGSYIKAYLFRRLGMTGLAQQEEAKLGAGSSTQRITMPDGTPAIVRMRSDGVASYGVDTTSGKELSADQLAMASAGFAKGTETGKTMYKTRDGHVITMSTVPGRVEPVYYDNTAKAILPNAPLGLTPLGQKDSIIESGLSAKKQIETAARKENNKAGGTQRTEQQIQELGNNAFRSIVGYDYNAREHGIVSPYEEARQAEPSGAGKTQVNLEAGERTVSGQGEFQDPSIVVISGKRPTAQQQAMWDESVAAGRPGKTATGNPIAKPGTSLHETDNARDIDAAKLTKSGRQELAQNGWYQPIPQQDPNHWERMPGYTPKAPAGEPAGINKNIEAQAQAIANYQAKPATAGGQQGAFNQAVMTRVRELNPDYDESKWDTAKKTRQQFTTGKQGDTVRSMNVAVDHLDTLDKAAKALNNGELPLLNKMMNDFSKNTGNPAVTNFEGIKSIVGSEVAKAVSGAGGSALGDREEIRKEINAANSPQQLAGVIKKYQELMAGQLKGLRVQYEDSGLKDFDKKIAPPTKAVMDRLEREKNTTRSNW